MSFGNTAVPMIHHQFTLTCNKTTVDETVAAASVRDHERLTGQEALAGEISCWIAAADTVTIRTNSNEDGHVCSLLIIKKKS